MLVGLVDIDRFDCCGSNRNDLSRIMLATPTPLLKINLESIDLYSTSGN